MWRGIAMKPLYLILATCLAQSPAFAADAPPFLNPACSSNFVRTFRTVGLAHYPDKKDYCAERRIPPEIARALDHIGVANRKISEFLGMSLEEAYGSPLAIQWFGSPQGPTNSSYSSILETDGAVQVYVFPDWQGDETFSESTYIHEAGHALAESKGHVPRNLAGLNNYRVFQESFADLLALWIDGGFTTPGDLPGNLKEIREVGLDDTFLAPHARFMRVATFRHTARLCAELRASGPLNAHARSVCDYNAGIMRNPKYNVRFAKGQFDPDRCPDASDESGRACDAHWVGVPFTSFLLDLEARLGERVRRMFLDSFRAAESDDSRFSCGFRFEKNEANRFVKAEPSYRAVFERLRGMLAAPDREVFDRLWKKHGLELGMKLADKDMREHVQTAAENERMDREYSRKLPYWVNAYNKCFDRGLPPDCDIVCRRIN